MSKIADAEANATSLDGLVNDNGLIPTLRNGPKPSYQYLVDGWNTEIAAAILEMNKSRGFRVVGTFADGFTYELFNDVGIDADGNSWIYVGAGAPNKVVPAGTSPSVSSGYQQVTYGTASSVFSNDGNNLQYHVDDIDGFTGALLDEAGIVPNGQPDTAASSQRLEALKIISWGVNRKNITLSDVVSDSSLKVGQRFRISDRADATFDVVLASGVTPNGHDIVQCTGVPSLALALDVGLFSSRNIKAFGASATATPAFNVSATQRALNVMPLVYILDGEYDLGGAILNIPADTQIWGNGKVFGGFETSGDNTQVHGITIELQPDSNGGNIPLGIEVKNASNHTADRVKFVTCGWRVSNERFDTSNDYELTNCKFSGDFTGLADFAVTIALGNAVASKITGNTFKQEGIYRLLKGTATGFGAGQAITDSWSKELIFSNNLIKGSIRNGGLQVIDIYSGLEKLVIDSNISTIKGGEQFLLAKNGSTSGDSNVAKKLVLSNNVVESEAVNTCIDLQGAFGQSFAGDPQNAIINGNIISTKNATRAFSIRGFNRVSMGVNDIVSDDAVANYIAIDIRASQNVNVSGGILTSGIISINESTVDPQVETVAITGVSILKQSGRGIDITGLKNANVITINSCIMDSAVFDAVRSVNSAVGKLIITGNANTGTVGFNQSGSTITKLVNVNNSWN